MGPIGQIGCFPGAMTNPKGIAREAVATVRETALKANGSSAAWGMTCPDGIIRVVSSVTAGYSEHGLPIRRLAETISPLNGAPVGPVIRKVDRGAN